MSDSVNFFTRYSYDPRRKTSAVDTEMAIRMRTAVKNDGHISIKGEWHRAIEKLVNAIAVKNFAAAEFGDDVVAVPIVKSTPIKSPDQLWVSMQICRQLRSEGLVGEIAPILQRKSAVRSSHQSGSNRVQISEHLNTIKIAPGADYFPGKRILLVDDFLTLGHTLMACYKTLRNQGYDNAIQGFPLILTKSLSNFTAFVDPTFGTIHFTNATHVNRSDKRA